MGRVDSAEEDLSQYDRDLYSDGDRVVAIWPYASGTGTRSVLNSSGEATRKSGSRGGCPPQLPHHLHADPH